MNKFITVMSVGVLFWCCPIKSKSEEGCVRGEPEQIFKKGVNIGIDSVSFKSKSSQEAEEQVVFSSGAKLFIRNWGCEYFVLTIRYESPTLKLYESSIAGVFNGAAEVLEWLEGFETSVPFDLGRASNTLSKVRTEGKNLKLKEEFPVDGDGTEFLQAMVSVLGGESAKKNRPGYVEFELKRGPL